VKPKKPIKRYQEIGGKSRKVKMRMRLRLRLREAGSKKQELRG
jgi:hypothetical protein